MLDQLRIDGWCCKIPLSIVWPCSRQTKCTCNLQNVRKGAYFVGTLATDDERSPLIASMSSKSMKPCCAFFQCRFMPVNANTPGMTYEVITDDVDSDTRWANVLLGASIDQTILGDIYRLGAEV